MLNVHEVELSRRRPVWEAMSNFFLDTELDENALREIATSLAKSGYSVPELEDILETELGPLLHGNLHVGTLAGVWDGFDVNFIEAQIRAREHRWYYRWYNVLSRWSCRSIVRQIKEDEWKRVLHFMKGC